MSKAGIDPHGQGIEQATKTHLGQVKIWLNEHSLLPIKEPPSILSDHVGV